MQISSMMQIAGLPAYRIRQSLMGGRNGFVWPICAGRLFVNVSDALAITDQLVVEGYLVPAQDLGTVKFYQRTQLGGRLAKAAAPPPLPAVDALQLLGRVIAHIRSLNTADDLYYEVTGVQVLGELLADNNPTIPHLELAIIIARKPNLADHAFGEIVRHAETGVEADPRQPLLDRVRGFHESVCFRVSCSTGT